MYKCPLCGAHAKNWADSFNRCSRCHLIFQDSQFLPGREQEADRYRLHNNSPRDKGYVKWLENFLERAVLPYVAPGCKALDYGCGAEPVLSGLIQARNYECSTYDPLFYNETAPEENAPYDLITVTEVVEHFHHPGIEFDRLHSLLKVDGLLSIMTSFTPYWEDPDEFLDWWYVKDFTHVSFYRESTFKYIAEKWGFDILYIGDGNKVVMRKLTT